MISPPSNSLLSRRQIFLIAGGIFILIVIFTLHRPTALPINQGHNHAPVMTGTSPADFQTQAQKEGSEVDGDYPFPTVTVTVTASTAAEATGVSAAGVGGGSGEVDGWKNPLAMTRRECVAEFPGLFQELERVVRLREGRKIKQSDLDSHYLRTFEGYTRVLIYENQLYVIESQAEPKFSRRLSSLHALDRAIRSSPHKLPNIEFNLNIWDKVNTDALTWSLTRKITDEPNQNNWLMPDFGLWSWPEPAVGSYQEVLRKADEVDNAYITIGDDGKKEHTLKGKHDLAVWRGAVLGNPIREGLVKLSKGKEWADVKVLNWGNQDELKKSLLSMADHCRYKYVLHTEGYSYSGRLKYLQACHSVVIIHEMEWTQHYYPLLVADGAEQNYVQVKRDWSDLEERIQWLKANPEVAEGIARRSREVMRKYQSEAANACYWREMVRAWGNLMDWEPTLWNDKDGKREWRGVPWESFAIMQKVHWDAS